MTIRSKSFSISLHGTVPMKVGAVLFIKGGRRISMSRYGSYRTGRIEDSEGTERHLETPISLTGKRVKKEEPKTNNRLCLVFVLGSYWRRWGECRSCIQQFPPRIKVYSLFAAKASPGHFHANRSSLQSRRHDYPTNRLNTSMIIEYSIFAA